MSHFCGYQQGLIDTQPPAHTHRHELQLGPLAILLPSSVLSPLQPSQGQSAHTRQMMLSWHPQIVTRGALSFVCLVLLLLLVGLFKNASYATASLKKKKGLPQKAMGITIKPWVLYSTSFLKCLRCLHIYNIFLISLSGPKQTAHGLGFNMSGFQCS